MAPRVFGDLFLCIGAAHAGTDWLREAMTGHPRLDVGQIGDVDYFYHRHVDPQHLSTARRRARVQSVGGASPPVAGWTDAYLSDPVDDQWYRRLYPEPLNAGFIGDFSHSYARLTAAHWRQIEAECTALKVLYVMRDPLARLWQHGLSDGKTPAAFWSAFHDSGEIDNAGDYARTLGAMQDGLRIGTWRVIFYEDLLEDPHATLGIIERFLGFDPSPDWRLPDGRDGGHPPPDPDHVPAPVAHHLAAVRRDVEAAGFSPPDCWQF